MRNIPLPFPVARYVFFCNPVKCAGVALRRNAGGAGIAGAHGSPGNINAPPQ